MLCGEWLITDSAKEFPACNLPADVAAAFTTALEGWSGAGYVPLMHLATQVVVGMNHLILCRETLAVAEPVAKIATVTLFVPATGDPQITNVTPLF